MGIFIGRAVLAALLLVLAWPAAADCHGLAPYRAVPAARAGHWTLATFNLWRLRDTRKDGPDDDPLTPSLYHARLDALAGFLIDTLHSPRLVAVQEVENRATLNALAERVRARGGPRYRAVLLEGNDPSGIDVGLLYRAPATLGPVRALFGDRRYRHRPLFSRPPLLVTVKAPVPFTLVVVHLRSARGLDRRWVVDKRHRQAALLGAWIKHFHGPLVVAGDFNSGPGRGKYAQPWRIIQRAGLYDSAQRLPADQRYSYRHHCRREEPDHILLSSAMAKRLDKVAVSRGNAGRYHLLYGDHGTRVVSDHDAPVVYFSAKKGEHGARRPGGGTLQE